MGASIESDGTRITVSPLSLPLNSLSLSLPGDISAAAFFLVAGAVHPDAQIRLRAVGVNPTRAGVVEVLQQMGANITVTEGALMGGEPVADLEITSSRLRGVEIHGGIIPRLIDEVPVLAVAAACASGATIIRGAAELRVKEADRIGATVAGLRKMGVDVDELPDGMIIRGGKRLRGASVNSHGDHRLAMAFAVAGLAAKGETTIDGAEGVEVSYPAFWQELERISRPRS
jgi:3-phosphoshikimate 1-carboxyvinyltransferase